MTDGQAGGMAMAPTALEPVPLPAPDGPPPAATSTPRWGWAPEGAVVALAFLLGTWSLDRNGWGNSYYAAAARSMTQSWSNFFFGSFDPGGWITVDKPPMAF